MDEMANPPSVNRLDTLNWKNLLFSGTPLHEIAFIEMLLAAAVGFDVAVPGAGYAACAAWVVHAAGDSGAGLFDDEPALGRALESVLDGRSSGLAARPAPLAR
jgi:hypothetical protein